MTESRTSGDDDDTVTAADVVEACLERLEMGDSGAVETACLRHPRLAAGIRKSLGRLEALGLVRLPVRAPSLPARIGPFAIEGVLGRGGMGIVYLAEEATPARRVALKVMRSDELEATTAKQRFAREIGLVAQLEHPGIVRIYSVGEADGAPWFAMEYVDGKSIAEILRTLALASPEALRADHLQALLERKAGRARNGGAASPLEAASWSEAAARIVLAAARAVDHAHARGVVHRDIKPSNLMIDRGGRVVLLDFGLAFSKDATQLTRSGAQMGSLPYMAPEQLRGDSAVDARTDVYALGATLYEMLTLKRPFSADSDEAVRRRILEGRFEAPQRVNPLVSRDLETVCLKAMEADAPRRYESAAAFAEDLENVLGRRPIAAKRSGPLGRTRRWAERHPARAVAALLAVLIVVGAPLAYAIFETRSAGRIRIALDKAKEERLAALRHRARAKDAVDRMLKRTASAHLADVPRMEGLRAQLFDDALALYDEMVAESGDDSEFLIGRAETLLQAGSLRLELGRTADAEADFRAALAVAETVSRRRPAHPKAEFTLERAVARLAHFHREVGQRDESVRRLEQALVLADRVAKAHPEKIDPIVEHAQLLTNLASVHGDVGRYDQALQAAERSAALFESLRGRAALSFDVDIELATVERSRGNAHFLAGRKEEAEQAYTSALERAAAASARDPESSEARRQVADSAIALGDFLAASGRPEKAVEHYRQSIAIRRAIVADHPAVGSYRNLLTNALTGLGGTLIRLDRHREALPFLVEAVGEQRRVVADFPRIVDFRELLMGALLNLGIARRAVGEVDQAVAAYAEALAIGRPLMREAAPDRARTKNYAALLFAWVILDYDKKPPGEGSLERAEETLELLTELRRTTPESVELRDQMLMAHRAGVQFAIEFGHWEEAERLACELPQIDRDAYQFAMVSALEHTAIVRELPRRTDLSPAAVKAKKESAAEAAVAMIREAKRRGWTEARSTMRDPTFAPLAGTEAMESLLDEWDQ